MAIDESGRVKPLEKRERGVLYQHPLYDKAFYEHLTAIEVHGIRFEKVTEARDDVCVR